MLNSHAALTMLGLLSGLAITLPACYSEPNVKPKYSEENIQADRYWEIIQNNQDIIERRMNDCLTRANQNRDVVYNDSNEVVDSCKEYAWESVGLPSGLMMSWVQNYRTK